MLTLNMEGVKPQTVQGVNKPVRRRILLLVTQADWGGVQSFLVRFARDLKAEGHEVLLAAGGTGEIFARAAEAGVPTRRLDRMVREISLLEDWRACLEIIGLIDGFKPDAVHLNSSKMGVIGSLAAARSAARPRVVYRIGGWAFLEPLAGWKKWVYRTAERFSAKYKDIILTVHPGDQALAEKIGIRPRGKTLTVANGLDFDGFTAALASRAAARQALGLPDGAFVFGTVANAYATKGLLPYLDTLQAVLAEKPDAWAVILGDGPQFTELKAKKQALGLDRLILTGHRDDANRLYRAFDVFVLPSVKEGMPWTALEAMASGVPIVATDVGACRWMTQDPENDQAALIVPPQNATALAEALENILADSALRGNLATAGPKIVRRRFTWESTYRGNRDALLG